MPPPVGSASARLDDAECVIEIRHEKVTGPTVIKKLQYQGVDEYVMGDGRPLIYEVKEYGVGDAYDRHRFYYDDWSRLTRETRDFISGEFQTPIFDYEYTYDLGGNRKSFTDNLNDLHVDYYHDVDESLPMGEEEPHSRDNRLLFSITTNQADPNDPLVLERTDYMYSYYSGNVVRTVTRPVVGTAGTAYGKWFIYDSAQMLRGIIAGNWDVDVNGVPEDYSGIDPFCEEVEIRWTLRKEFRYDGPRQRYLEREWQPVPFPERWPWDGQRGSEYAMAIDPETISTQEYRAEQLSHGDAVALAQSLGGLPHLPNDLQEWQFITPRGYTWSDGYEVPLDTIGWVGAYQDPNAPDFSEPDGGWYWMTGNSLDPWCNPLTHDEGTPPWHFWMDPNDGGGGPDPDPDDDGTYPQESTIDGSEPDDTAHGNNIAWARKWTNGNALANWEDLAADTEENAPALIERPIFVKDEWRDYDGDSIYADWTVNLAAMDGNDVPAPKIVHLRTYLAGAGFVDYTDPNTPVTRVFHADHLGTTRALTDATATVVAQFFYNAWGVLEGATGSAETRYGYVGTQGYQTDAATGLMHLGARYYDATIGRFMQRDPIGIRGGLNIYVYCYNNPLQFTDAEGEAGNVAVGGGVVALGLGVTVVGALVPGPAGDWITAAGAITMYAGSVVVNPAMLIAPASGIASAARVATKYVVNAVGAAVAWGGGHFITYLDNTNNPYTLNMANQFFAWWARNFPR
ncbi:MAG: hypothetical protein A49_31800 [Methyloceanibacter sp.]|nr:MAG: hypothetical protein A49_31800 [Methyloceanibacter sp.]